MKTVTFKSNSDDKIDLLIKVAKEMGIEAVNTYPVLDEDDLGLPGPKVSEAQLEEWLTKEEDDERYSSEEVLNQIKKDLEEKRKK